MKIKTQNLLITLGISLISGCLIIANPWQITEAKDMFYSWVEDGRNESGELNSITRYFDWHLDIARNNWGRRKTETYDIWVPQGYNYSYFWVKVEPESYRGRLKVKEIKKRGEVKGIQCEASVTSQGFWGNGGYLRGYCRLFVQPTSTSTNPHPQILKHEVSTTKLTL
jgi:hypothetical protein